MESSAAPDIAGNEIHLPPIPTIILGIFLSLAGGIFCVSGYRVHLYTPFFTGYFSATFISSLFIFPFYKSVPSSTNESLVWMAACMAPAFLGGAIAHVYGKAREKLIKLLTGAIGGFGLGMLLFSLRTDGLIPNSIGRYIILVILTLAGGGCTLLPWGIFAWLLAYASTGAYAFFVGLDLILRTGYALGYISLLSSSGRYVLSGNVIPMATCALLMAVLGFGWQGLNFRRNLKMFRNVCAVQEEIEAVVHAHPKVVVESNDSWRSGAPEDRARRHGQPHRAKRPRTGSGRPMSKVNRSSQHLIRGPPSPH
ncbi:uncharacterized protein VTP21DRAFT_9140 [Calcarisporiella thermophila]|uniref:uncharacterized protein n=1 Tax=Calcarisporiella thermophila TaxID=911321 RepID=UPI0037441A51